MASQAWLNNGKAIPESSKAVRAAMKAAYDAAGYNELHQPVPTPLREATHRHSVVTHPHTTTLLDHTVAHPAQSAATKRDEDTNKGKEKQIPRRANDGFVKSSKRPVHLGLDLTFTLDQITDGTITRCRSM